MKGKKNQNSKLTNSEIVRKYNQVNLVIEGKVSKMDSRLALQHAQSEDLDLVLMSLHGDVPICKTMDYGKYVYELKRKAKEALKKTAKIEIKEIRLGLDIGVNDLNHKADKAIKFLSDGHILKVSLRIKGWRNMARKDTGKEVINSFFDILKEKYSGNITFTSKPSMPKGGKSWHAVIENDKKKN